MLKGFIIGLLAIAILLSQVHAIDSDTVKDIAQYYANKGEEQVEVPGELNPLTYKDIRYFHAYLRPQDSTTIKNLVVIVREEVDTGRVETNDETLRTLFSVDYDIDTLDMLRERKISYEDLKTVVLSLKDQIDNSESKILENVKRQSEEDFTKIDDALYDMQTSIDDASALAEDGLIAKDTFYETARTQELPLSDLSDVFKKYDDLLVSIFEFSGEAETYQKAVSEMMLSSKEQQIVSELAKMGNLKVGDSIIKSYNSSLAQKRKELENRKNRKAAYINDSIKSWFSRKTKVEADKAFNAASDEGLIDSLLSSKNEASLAFCKLSNAELKSRWSAIKTAMEGQQYALVPLKINEASAIAQTMKTRLDTCMAATATPTTKPTSFDFKGLLGPGLAVIVIVLAVYFFGNYMKPKEGEQAQE